MKGKKIKGSGISSQVSSKNLKIKAKTNRGKLRKTEEGYAQPDVDEFGRVIAAVINMEKSFKKKKGDKKRITEKDNGPKMGSSKRKKGAIISGGEDQLQEVKIEPDVDDIALDGHDLERMKNDMVSIEVRRNTADAFSSSKEAKLKYSGIKVEVTENAQDTVLGKYVERSSNRKKKSKRSKIKTNEDEQVPQIKTNEDEQVPQIASVDKDASTGMKKWLNDYKKSRPGLKILQQSIDDFIAAFESQEEKARKEREAQAAEGGWTVVVHHKGRKKTTDSESGITVGSVAQGAVTENMSKKKKKDTPLDFYRFQKREARRTELMMLQSKFEQDKKRIQQLRAARKFKPY